MPPVYREFPESWAKDTFTSFLDMAIGNLVTTTDRDKNEYPLVEKLDDAFLDVVRALVNPTAIVEAVLLMRGHASFRSAAILALGGLNPEAFV